ncbi:AP-3 complex subunit delta-1 [Acrasis kona]|uniref:AP-3 complex subunit delta-1 n=1 Tax=Acrasis kona TaxID=1008807 RepID=A0AAW2Z9L7_9EUKA
MTCAKDNYANISNFKWYLEKLIDLTNVKSVRHGHLIASQLMNVLIRVKSIRAHGVAEMIKLINSPQLHTESAETSSVFEVLYAAAWITGEFISESQEDPRTLLEGLLTPQLSSLPDRIQSCYIQAIMKIYAHAASRAAGSVGVKQQNVAEIIQFDDASSSSLPDASSSENNVVDSILDHDQRAEMRNVVTEMRDLIRNGLDSFLKTSDVEVQERAATCLKLLDIHQELLQEGNDIGPQIASLFEEELNPVAPRAQSKVPIPEGLNLEDWIGTPFDQLVDPKVFQEPTIDIANSPVNEYSYQNYDLNSSSPTSIGSGGIGKDTVYNNPDTYNQAKSVFTLVSRKSTGATDVTDVKNASQGDLKKKKTKDGSKDPSKKKKKKRTASINEPPPVVSNVEELPEGAMPEMTNVRNSKNQVDVVVDRLSQIDLTSALTDKDILPQVEAYPLKSEAKPVRVKSTAINNNKSKQETTPPTRKKRSSSNASASSSTAGDKKKKKKKKSTAESSATTSTTTTSSNILDFLEDTPAAPSSSSSPNNNKKMTKESSTKKRIAKDDQLRIVYSTKPSLPDNMHIHIPFYFDNIGQGSISNLEYNLDSTMNVKFIRPNMPPTSNSTVKLPFTIDAAQSQSTTIVLQYKSFARAQSLNGHVQYEDANKNVHKLAFTLPLPSSMFMVSKKMSVPEFGTLNRSNAMPNPSSTLCKVSEKYPDVKAVAKEISKMLHLSVVDSVADQVYLMYGSSATTVPVHLAVQVKTKSDKEVLVEFKCSDDTLGNSLLSEVHKQFRG